ncbi:FRAS1-related extracellular matrix protein 1-like [Uloborus diversus]|uniref:FRAS1-related extracellular matrix protein 1-like n=1 Tax=Uloborus diversus TaxID=327109 RepID=UPI0024096E17|nr:FRAS1-related extracellular matrix protein 1-like [Uloborus diversus]
MLLVAFDNFDVILQDVNNPPNSSPPFKVLVRIIPVGDDPPKRDPASSFNIEVHENDFGIFGNQHLCYMDIDSLASEITYTIITYPRFIGSLAHADPGKVVLFSDGADLEKESNWTSVNTFTQEQINHHKIAYVPPKDEIGPNPLYLQFIFSVTDKDNNVVPGQVFNITILPVNNKVPQLHTGELLVEEGSSTLLSTNELSVYDPDTLTSDLQMSLFTIPLHGSLRRSEQPLRVGDLLSLDDILTLRLEYVHDGSESFKDGFKIGVNDGLHFVSGVVRVSIEPVDDEKPIWAKDLMPRISVNEGGKVLLTPEILAATDIDTDDSSLFFILTEVPLFGSIVLEKHKVNRFTQSNVLTGEVAYMHNGQEIGPSPKEDALTFIVTDKLFPRSISHESHRVFVTILPQNDRPPRLYFKRAILVEEGRSSVITDENLSATDDDTFASELLIVIAKQPEYGYIENSRPTPGYEQNDGKRINAFPLQDVKNGFITFVQFNHSNVEPESDGFEVFVTDGVHNSTSVLVFVSIVLLNDEVPMFSISNISLDEGGSFVMKNSSVIASDRDFPGDILIITVKTRPQYGTLTHFVQAVNNGPLLEIPFTQLSFENFESIVYRHDGSENFKDSFVLVLSDGLHNVVDSCFIDIIPVNDEAPFIVKNIPASNVELLGNFLLSNAVLLADDIDTSSTELFFKIVEHPTQGILEQKNEKGDWFTLNSLEFSQEDINLNLIRYRHTSENIQLHEDTFKFFVFDGVHESVPAVYTIKLIAKGKSTIEVINKGAVVEHGSEVILNSSVLYAFDNSSIIEDMVFYVMKIPTYGVLNLNGSNSYSGQNFSVSDLVNNYLSYRHNATFKVTSDSFGFMITNGVTVTNVTFDVTISSLVIKIPILEIVIPLVSDRHDSNTYIITSEHLLSYQPGKNDSKIIYEIIDSPKFGTILLSGKVFYPISFSQEDINKNLVSYVANVNSSMNDHFSFKVTNNEEEGYLFGGKLMIIPTVFEIFLKSTPQVAELSVLIRSPTDLENVWNHLAGFFINSYNLKATFLDSSASDIRYHVTKYLQHGYIFNVKEEKFVRSFTQEEINEQLIVVILKQEVETSDYFLFHIAIKQVTYNKEYKMEFQWAAVFFPFLEYSVCEDAAALNIVIHRKGNLDISSYVTISAVEQTAREGLDFVSRYVNKIQFDPGISEVLWKIIIVQDDLEEAPIEQLQVILSEPENCIISYKNRTIVSIYDLNRGSCSKIPVIRSETHKGEAKPPLKVSERSELENNECNQDIYGLLHFKQSTQSLFQCDGKKWLPWHSTKSNASNIHSSFGIPHIDDNERIEDKLDNNTEASTSEEQESTTFLPENCPKGWIEFIGKCHKWQRQPVTWNAAKDTCESFPSSQLVVIESLEHNTWLLQLARGKPFWIGLHMSLESSDWKYTEQNDVSFFNWKKGFPRLPQSGEVKHRCVLARGSGQWINKNCEFHDHSFICVMPKSTSAVGDLQ